MKNRCMVLRVLYEIVLGSAAVFACSVSAWITQCMRKQRQLHDVKEPGKSIEGCPLPRPGDNYSFEIILDLTTLDRLVTHSRVWSARQAAKP